MLANLLPQPGAGLVAALALVLCMSGCASRGPSAVMVAPAATPTPSLSANTQKLKLVTYNIWGLPLWMTGAKPGRYAKIARELERLDADVVLLQEAWTSQARKSAPADGRWFIARAAGQHTFFQQSGLVTLSKLPIIGGKFYPFSHAEFPDRLVNKGALKVSVELAGGRVLNIWNVHLQDGGSAEVRRSQVRQLISWVQEAEDGQVADVIGGDFNCTPESAEYEELACWLGPSMLQAAGGLPFVTWDGLSAKPGAGRTLDYIFARGRTAHPVPEALPCVAFTAPTSAQRLSDHFGIEAEMNLNLAPNVTAIGRPHFYGPPSPVIAARGNVYVDGQ
jgi:endonuclease/exonuclease/phosphatase family metal-dependent hydrolase